MCLWNCVHSHLICAKVIYSIYVLVFSYKYALLLFMIMVFLIVTMSFLGLQLRVDIVIRDSKRDCVIYLKSWLCVEVKCFLYDCSKIKVLLLFQICAIE